MFFKKIKSFIAIFLVATFIMPQSIFAYSKYIVAGGENIGLQINNDGIIVAGFYKVGEIYPGYDANLIKGDIIVKVDNNKINTTEDFINAIKESNGQNLNITYVRDKQEKNTTLNLIKEDGITKTGLYIKDMISGIGTLTFIDPNTKFFGALGHEIVNWRSITK